MTARPPRGFMAAEIDSFSADGIARAAQLIRNATYVLALTGAGISTPSGIPDFRSPSTGLWSQVDPMIVASLQGFRSRPEAFYEWVRPLARLMLTATPNPAHFALAHLEAAGYLRAVVTQNIDMLHTRAGSKEVYEVHGNLREATCISCYRVYPGLSRLEQFVADGAVPYCEACGAVLKPNVILFGEQLPATEMNRASRAVRRCDLMLVAGSSLEVYPVADLPRQARAHGARLIIVNREPTPMDASAHVLIRADVAEALPQVTAEVLGE